MYSTADGDLFGCGGAQLATSAEHLLHPPLLDEIGFSSAAQWCVEGFTKRSSSQVSLNQETSAT
jgi:hypothetical protein